MSKTAWQPIKTAPNDSDVLLYFPEQMRSWDTSDIVIEPRIVIGRRASPSHEWEGESPIEGDASHWMQLPEPPAKPRKP